MTTDDVSVTGPPSSPRELALPRRGKKSPWPTLTLVVSLEAIFLSTFVMIGQNRQGEYAQKKADHDFDEQERELHVNTELTKQIHQLSTEMHAHLLSVGAVPARSTDDVSPSTTDGNAGG